MQSHKKNINRTKMFQKLILIGMVVTGITASSVYSMESYSQKLREGIQPSPDQIMKEANKGHIPSKILILEQKAVALSLELNKIRNMKNTRIQNLHNQEALSDVKTLINLGKQTSALEQQLFQIAESIHELEMCLENAKRNKNKKSMYLKNDTTCLFVDDSEESENESSVTHIPKPEPKLIDILNDRLKSVHSFFEWRLKVNQKILAKLETLYDYVGADSKTILDGFMEAVEQEIASNEVKISKDKAYLSLKSKTNKEKHSKISYCDKILNFDGYLGDCRYVYKITPTILSYINNLAKYNNFLSPAHNTFMKEALNVINEIIAIESDDEEDSNNQKLSICDEFLVSHDAAFNKRDISPSQRLEMLMATLHFASRQLKKINSDCFDDEDGIYSEFYIKNNSVLSIEGKYVSWYLNQTYKSYNHLLFRGACINHDLLKFCNFSQQIQEMIGRQDYYGIIVDLIGSNVFELPICQYGKNHQVIFVHKTEPFVFRLKNNGIYTIGLISKSSFKNNDWSLFFRSHDYDVGPCYYRIPNTFQYPSITDDHNELLKFTYYLSCQGGAASHGGVIPAGWSDRNQWQNHIPNAVRGNLMQLAHFQY